jgi:AcrR family transcriptional regulator
MTLENSDRASRWRRRKQDRPGEILEAALACFAERGFAATRLDDVARRAGVTKGTLYLYFPNKEELFKAVVRQELLPNIARIEAMVEQAPLPPSRLLAELIGGWAAVIASPVSAIPKIVIGEAGNFPDLARFYLEEVVHRGFALVARILRAGIAAGEFRPLDVEEGARCVVAPLLLAMLWRHSLGRYEPQSLDPEALCRTHLRLLLDGLAVRPVAAVPSSITPRSADDPSEKAER